MKFTFIPLACALVLGGLWLFERQAGQELTELNSRLTAANAGQAATIAELRTERTISEHILLQREVELENIRNTAATDKAGITRNRQVDEKLAAWLAAPLPAYVAGLLGHADSDANQDREADPADDIAAGSAGTGLARR
ncbi:MAG: hypothetical protein LBV80_04195 [Deltaproteobacteria bacterium]|jgi:hypothetical protein|nr:hypothetical protein [Deltaproteobacteria bacterium]